MRKLVAVAASDFHINDWKEAYSYKGSRLSDSLQVLKYLGDEAISKGVPILFAGDLFHKPKAISNTVLSKFITSFKDNIRQETSFIAIAGNHDQCEKHTNKNTSPDYITSLSKVFENLMCINNLYWECKDFIVAGIPYHTNNLGFRGAKQRLEAATLNSKKPKILLIHRDLPGAKNPQGFEVNESEDMTSANIAKEFKKWDLVLCGHIHKPQVIRKNIIMLGSPSHQNAGDMGIDMGYWEIYDDMSAIFKKLILPEYKYYKPGEQLPDDFHIYIPLEEEPIVQITTEGKFTNKMDKVKLAKNYLKAKGIKNSSKKRALVNSLISK